MKVKVTGKRSLFITKEDIRELLHYRDLLFMLVRRDVYVLYKQTVMGFGWAVIRPFLQMVLFTIVFGKFAGIENSLEGVPYAIFSFVALVPWNYFSASLTGSTASLITNITFLDKVYFPRVIIPLTPILAKLVDFVIAFVILIGLMIYYGIMPTANVVYLPLFVLMMVMTSLGIGLWFSAMAIQYRDVNQMIQYIVQILMYIAPVIWPVKFIPEQYRLIYGLYPMAGVIEGFRAALLGGKMPWDLIGMGALTAVILLFTGLIYFRNKERIFADVY